MPAASEEPAEPEMQQPAAAPLAKGSPRSATGSQVIDSSSPASLLELVNHLEARGPAPDAFAHLNGDELWLTPANRYNRARVHVAVVWRDYGPVRDGLPEMHYRLSIRRDGMSLSREERSSDLAEVERAICGAFGWATPGAGDRGDPCFKSK